MTTRINPWQAKIEPTGTLPSDTETLQDTISFLASGSQNTYYSATRAEAEAKAGELGDGATIWIDSDDANGGVRTRNAVIGRQLTDPPVVDEARQIAYRHSVAASIRSVYDRLQDAVSVSDYQHYITDRPSGDPATWDWGPAFQAAVAENDFVRGPRGTISIRTSVDLRSGNTLWMYDTKVNLPSSLATNFYPFRAIAPYTPATYFTEFLHDIAIYGGEYVGDSVIDGDGWTKVMVLKAVNVRGCRVIGTKLRRVGGLWVRHAIEEAGLYNQSSSYVNATYANDSFWANGGNPLAPTDLNEDIWFCNNEVEVDGYYRQACRVHFFNGCTAFGNRVDFGCISFWGGNPDAILDMSVLRRARDLSVFGNRVSRNQAGIYAMMPQAFSITGNICKYSLDVCIDVEGAFDGVIANNVCWDAGRFVFATYWYGQSVRFSSNIGVQTGKGKNLAENTEIFGTPYPIDRFPSLPGNVMLGDSGVDGVINVHGREIIDVVGNTFTSYATFPVYVAGSTYSSWNLDLNTFYNVVIDSDISGATAGIPSIRRNKIFINRNLGGVPIIRAVVKVLQRAFVIGNEITVTGSGVQTGVSKGILLECNSFGTSGYIECKRNEVRCLDNSSELTHSIAYSLNSESTNRKHYADISGNVARNISDLSTSKGHSIVTRRKNYDQDFNPLEIGSPPADGQGYAAGVKFRVTDLATSTHEGLIASVTGFSLGASYARAPSTAYAVGAMIFSGAFVYIATVAGTSSASTDDLTGTSPVDGSVTWFRIGSRQVWRKYGALSD